MPTGEAWQETRLVNLALSRVAPEKTTAPSVLAEPIHRGGKTGVCNGCYGD